MMFVGFSMGKREFHKSETSINPGLNGCSSEFSGTEKGESSFSNIFPACLKHFVLKI